MSATGQASIAEVIGLLARNEREARATISLVPSENSLSGLAKLPLLLDGYHRYFFNETDEPERWLFRGAQRIGAIEMRITGPVLRELALASYSSVRPLSGLSAMALVLAALGGDPGSAVLTIAPANGGHYATPSLARRFGLRVSYLGGPDPHTLDYENVTAQVAKLRPALVYVDQSHALFPIDVARLVTAVRAAGGETLVHVDASHFMGLVLGGAFPNPLECGADSFGGSTHKTFPGPHKAVFTTRRADLAQRIEETQDYLISSHHFAATVSLGLALLEFRDYGGREYAQAIIENTARLGRRLAEHGCTLAAADRGFSAGHQLWLDTEADGLPAMQASDRLFAAGLRVNVAPELPGFAHRAVRIGVNEPTFHGLRGADIDDLAEVFVLAMRAQVPPSDLASRVADLRNRGRGRYGIRLEPGSELLEQALALCSTVLLDDQAVEQPWNGQMDFDHDLPVRAGTASEFG
jgi:glycine/serine hydroxymethyltransferase